jgi:Uma2 family endonuclease
MVAPTSPYPTIYSDRLITADELAAMPEHARYELVLGRLVPLAPASTDHGDIGANLSYLVMHHVRTQGLGRTYIAETGFDISQPGDVGQTVLGADLAFIRADRVPARGSRPTFKKVVPDMVYEIASDSQSSEEMADKARLWTGRGVRLCWIQWPARNTIDVWHPGDTVPRTLRLTDVLDGEVVLPGFRCPVSAAFE